MTIIGVQKDCSLIPDINRNTSVYRGTIHMEDLENEVADYTSDNYAGIGIFILAGAGLIVLSCHRI